MAGMIDIKEAAEILGLEPDELAELRSRGELRGYRDGATWKFKKDDIERLAASRRGAEEDAPTTPFDADLDKMVEAGDLNQGDDLDPSSVLVSDQALGKSPEGTASTIIGKGEKGEKKPPAGGDSDIQVAGGGKAKAGKPGGSDVLTGSGVRGKGGSSKVQKGGKGSGDSGFDLDAKTMSARQDDLSLGEDLSMGDEPTLAGGSGKKAGSGINLDDDDQVLGPGSDVTKNAGDSGIGLANPADSGLSLEEPLELGGSGAESLELGEDEMVSLSDEPADPEVATQLKPDDQFQLTPVEGAGGDDADSGSQVIALDTDEYGDDANTMLATGAAAAPLLEAETALLSSPLDAGAAMPGPAAGPLMVSMQAPEMPYSVWNVVSLALVVILLTLTGIMMSDLVRNMWHWDHNMSASSALMDKILEMFGS